MAYDPVPTFTGNAMVHAAEMHRAKIEQTKENSARLAQAYTTITTTGDGEFVIADAVQFGCLFTEQPVVAYGYSLTDPPGPDQLIVGNFPRATGFVTKWEQDEKKRYTGCHVAIVIDTSTVQTTSATVSVGSTAANVSSDTTPTKVFTDAFARPDSTLVGNGWSQTGGDWSLSNQRVTTNDTSSYLCRPFGLMPMTVQAKLRSPDGGSPAIFCWSNATAGAGLGYALSFNALAGGTNLVIARSGTQVAAAHMGPSGSPIGNVDVILKLSVSISGTTVNVAGYFNGAKILTYSESVTTAPTGTYCGGGNRGTGSVAMDDFVAGEITVAGEAAPDAASPISGYVIDHDFTFTGIAQKDIPDIIVGLAGGAPTTTTTP